MPPVIIAAGITAAAGAYSAKSAKRGTRRAETAAKSPFDSALIQGFLPPQLRGNIGGLAELRRNPGGMNPNIGAAIGPLLAMNSERIATDFRGIGANQAGAAARSNLPVSIKNALSSALDVAQSRAQRDSRRGALVDSEQLRRSDIASMLNAQLQFTQGGRGQVAQTITANNQINQQQTASQMAALGSIMQGAANYKKA